MSVLNITKENFEQEVLHADKPVLLDFWAVWCNPCRMAAPILEQVAADTEGTVTVGKINIEEEPELVSQFGITSVPTFVALKNGSVTGKAVGLQARGDLLKMVQ